jgi:GT2 family glycosyltransferase
MTIHFPSVIVGITTLNRAVVLPKAISSALAQDYPNLSITVLDDGSTDATPALAATFPEVSWQRNEVPQGIIEARNLLMAANADYYLSLDDDAWFLRGDEISVAIAYMEAHFDVGAVAFDILSPDRVEPEQRSTPKSVGMFIGCGHVLRLSAVRDAGFYASCPGAYGSEEKDLCLRLADLGHAIVLLPGVHVWHDKEWTGRDWYPLHRSGVCNDLMMAARRCPFPDVLAVIPFKILSHVRFGLKKREMLRPAIAGILLFFRHLSGVFKSRRPVKREVFFGKFVH